MKPSIISILTLIAITSCTDDLSVAPDTQNLNLNANSLSQLTPAPAGEYVWTSMPNYNDADGAECSENVNTPTQISSFCRAVTINEDVYVFAGPSHQIVRKLNKSSKQWETFSQTTMSAMRQALQVSNYLFSYGNKMYTGMWNEGNAGWYPGGIVRTVNHVTGSTSVVAPFPGKETIAYMSFAVGNKGYVMGGYEIDSFIMSEQYWEYNFDTNTWTDRGTIPGGIRAGGTVHVVGNEVYLGLGYSSMDNDYNNDYSRVYRMDWIKFDPSNPSSVTTLRSFPGKRRSNAKAFTLNDKVYVGWGYGHEISHGNPEDTDDLWEFNPTTNTWREKTKCPGNSQVKSNRAVFVQGNATYVVIGCFSRFWRYSKSSAVPVPPGGPGPVIGPTNP